jgi:hypothetical protein
MSADAVPTVRTSARYLNDRTRYPILLGRTVPQALGIGGGALLLIAVWNLAAGPYQVATIFYSGAGEPYARQHVGFACRWLRRHARIVAGHARARGPRVARAWVAGAGARAHGATNRGRAARPRIPGRVKRGRNI